MREIVFRAKRVADGEWVYGYFVSQYRANEIYLPNGIDDDGFDKRHIIPETVGQYTGLTDKNGKRIFEGDIIEYDKDGARYEVIFAVENGIAKFCSKDLIDGTLGYINKGRDKVIGNIHDNPELLKVWQ